MLETASRGRIVCSAGLDASEGSLQCFGCLVGRTCTVSFVSVLCLLTAQQAFEKMFALYTYTYEQYC